MRPQFVFVSALIFYAGHSGCSPTDPMTAVTNLLILTARERRQQEQALLNVVPKEEVVHDEKSPHRGVEEALVDSGRKEPTSGQESDKQPQGLQDKQKTGENGKKELSDGSNANLDLLNPDIRTVLEKAEVLIYLLGNDILTESLAGKLNHSGIKNTTEEKNIKETFVYWTAVTETQKFFQKMFQMYSGNMPVFRSIVHGGGNDSDSIAISLERVKDHIFKEIKKDKDKVCYAIFLADPIRTNVDDCLKRSDLGDTFSDCKDISSCEDEVKIFGKRPSDQNGAQLIAKDLNLDINIKFPPWMAIWNAGFRNSISQMSEVQQDFLRLAFMYPVDMEKFSSSLSDYKNYTDLFQAINASTPSDVVGWLYKNQKIDEGLAKMVIYCTIYANYGLGGSFRDVLFGVLMRNLPEDNEKLKDIIGSLTNNTNIFKEEEKVKALGDFSRIDARSYTDFKNTIPSGQDGGNVLKCFMMYVGGEQCKGYGNNPTSTNMNLNSSYFFDSSNPNSSSELTSGQDLQNASGMVRYGLNSNPTSTNSTPVPRFHQDESGTGYSQTFDNVGQGSASSNQQFYNQNNNNSNSGKGFGDLKLDFNGSNFFGSFNPSSNSDTSDVGLLDTGKPKNPSPTGNRTSTPILQDSTPDYSSARQNASPRIQSQTQNSNPTSFPQGQFGTHYPENFGGSGQGSAFSGQPFYNQNNNNSNIGRGGDNLKLDSNDNSQVSSSGDSNSDTSDAEIPKTENPSDPNLTGNRTSTPILQDSTPDHSSARQNASPRIQSQTQNSNPTSFPQGQFGTHYPENFGGSGQGSAFSGQPFYNQNNNNSNIGRGGDNLKSDPNGNSQVSSSGDSSSDTTNVELLGTGKPKNPSPTGNRTSTPILQDFTPSHSPTLQTADNIGLGSEDSDKSKLVPIEPGHQSNSATNVPRSTSDSSSNQEQDSTSPGESETQSDDSEGQRILNSPESSTSSNPINESGSTQPAEISQYFTLTTSKNSTKSGDNVTAPTISETKQETSSCKQLLEDALGQRRQNWDNKPPDDFSRMVKTCFPFTDQVDKEKTSEIIDNFYRDYVKCCGNLNTVNADEPFKGILVNILSHNNKKLLEKILKYFPEDSKVSNQDKVYLLTNIANVLFDNGRKEYFTEHKALKVASDSIPKDPSFMQLIAASPDLVDSYVDMTSDAKLNEQIKKIFETNNVIKKLLTDNKDLYTTKLAQALFYKIVEDSPVKEELLWAFVTTAAVVETEKFFGIFKSEDKRTKLANDLNQDYEAEKNCDTITVCLSAFKNQIVKELNKDPAKKCYSSLLLNQENFDFDSCLKT